MFDDSAEPPEFLKSKYVFNSIPGKVVVDLFSSGFCRTLDIEARRVREVAAEFGDKVVLNEYCNDDMEILHRYQTHRGIFINGEEIGWGYEAPKDGIREAINRALNRCSSHSSQVEIGRKF